MIDNALKYSGEAVEITFLSERKADGTVCVTMDRADGVGLAAPQVGLPIRVVVVNLDVLSDDMPEFKDFKRTAR